MSDILKKIVEIKLARLAAEKRLVSREAIEQKASEKPRPMDFPQAFAGSGIHIMAEVKKASPSKGILKADLDPAALARAYAHGGASAVSVLTEQDHFSGSLKILELVRDQVALPILRKDFITDDYQVIQARAAGADSFLLIVGLLNFVQLKRLMELGRAWQMEPLVEVHNSRQLHSALNAGARCIGINNRDLRTFRVNLDVSLQLVKKIPQDRTVISESGIRSREDILRLSDAGIKGCLIGESIVTSPDPAAKLRELIHGSM
jgi:indole-3-glycerol phosphate synthase